jgi:hypothetical protein
MKQAAEKKGAPARRFVHLGDRLFAIGRIRAGSIGIDEAARELGVERAEVVHWMDVHASECLVTFEELREKPSPEVEKLTRRAQRLADMVAQAERLLRDLHTEFTSKQFGENPHLRTLRVAHAQPRGD